MGVTNAVFSHDALSGGRWSKVPNIRSDTSSAGRSQSITRKGSSNSYGISTSISFSNSNFITITTRKVAAFVVTIIMHHSKEGPEVQTLDLIA